MTRLQARISSLERAAGRHHHMLSLPALPPPHLSPSLDPSPSARSAPASPTAPLQTAVLPPGPPHLPLLLSSHPQPPHPPSQTCSWSLADSSLDLPESVKATLREALSKQPWESSSASATSSSSSCSMEQSWQGLSALEASAASDLSFNPLTYMAGGHLGAESLSTLGGVQEQASESRRESVSTLVAPGEGEEEAEDMSTLTGMLRFVNQTLAKQEDPSLWSSTGLQESGHGLPLQVTTHSALSYTG